MAYSEISRCGAIVCTHVANHEKPILRAVRDQPIQPEDSGWQFTCRDGEHEADHAQLWLLSEVAAFDPSILAIADSEIGTAFEREAGGSSWTPVQHTE